MFKPIKTLRSSNFKLKNAREVLSDSKVKDIEFSPSSPIRMTNYDRKKLVPFSNLNKKTYFKTIEHII
jgi:hypothetical protein